MSKKIEKGRGNADYKPSEVDFNPKVQPNLPPKMTPAEIAEAVKRVDAKPKGK